MKISFDILLPCSLLRDYERIAPVLENKRLLGTDTIILIFCLAILCKLGYMLFIMFHASNGEIFKLLIIGFAKKSQS